MVVSQASWTEKPAARRMEKAAWGPERAQEDTRMAPHLDVLHGLNLPVIDLNDNISRLNAHLSCSTKHANLLNSNFQPTIHNPVNQTKAPLFLH